MPTKLTPAQRSALTTIKGQLKQLQKELTEAKKREGIDAYITVKVKDRNGHFMRTRNPDGPDKAVGRYTIMLYIAAKSVPVYVPLSIASSKTPTGFMYYIEGTGESSVVTAAVTARGDGMTVVKIGTLEYSKIPAGGTALFHLDITIRGKIGKKYQVVVDRINYKLSHTDARYQQYLKPIISKPLKFS